MTSELPPFRPFTLDELRGVWTRHPDDDIQRLVLEVVRYRRVMTDIYRLYQSTHHAWREQVGGNLVALHMLQKVMEAERERIG